MTVPGGGVVATAASPSSGRYPTHRRRGVLRAMMRAQLDDVHGRGEPVAAALGVARRRSTVGSATGWRRSSDESSCRASTVPSHSPVRARRRSASSTGTRRCGSSRASGTRLAAGPRECSRARRNWWEFRLLFEPPGGGGEGGPKRFVVLERDGRPEGYAIYRHKPKFEDGEFRSASSRSSRRLRWTADRPRSSGGTSSTSTGRRRSPRDLLPRRPSALVASSSPRRDACATGSATGSGCGSSTSGLRCRRGSYAADGALVVDVVDEFCPWNEGRWRIADGHAPPFAATAQLRCDVSALGSVYLGGFSFSQLVRGGRVEELRRGAAARADAMFATDRAPVVPGDLLSASDDARSRGQARGLRAPR